MENDIKLSVVIPAFNESGRLPSTIERISAYLEERTDLHPFEIIVVDDGSTDETASVTQKMSDTYIGLRLVSNESNKGKGYSVRHGVMESSGSLVLLSDADLSTPIEEIEKCEEALGEDCDIAIGSRGLSASDVRIRQPWYREGMGRGFNLLVSSLVIGGFKDTQCGFKLFKGDIARRIFEHTMIDGFSFDVETIFLARRMGYRISEVPVVWLNSPNSRVRIASDPARMFLDLLVIRLNWLLGRYRI